jgi:hypothetical protein
VQPYNHYSLLRSIESNFGLPYLGYAGQAGLRPFGEDILNQPACSVPNPCKAKRKHKKHHTRRRAADAAKHKKHKKHKQRKCKKDHR